MQMIGPEAHPQDLRRPVCRRKYQIGRGTESYKPKLPALPIPLIQKWKARPAGSDAPKAGIPFYVFVDLFLFPLFLPTVC